MSTLFSKINLVIGIIKSFLNFFSDYYHNKWWVSSQ